MSEKYPVIAITGSSGSGTSTVSRTFEKIFKQENIHAAMIQGDAFHRYTRAEMGRFIELADKSERRSLSHFGVEANHLQRLEALFEGYGRTGQGERRHYLHDEQQAQTYRQPAGTFTHWEPLPDNTDLLFYEGLHGGVVTARINLAQHVDLLIGVVPIINLEWIQKIHRDTHERGYDFHAVKSAILRRMHDYVHTIVPQFSRTHINFQRVPMVDTSNPFVTELPANHETQVVIHAREGHDIDFAMLDTTIIQAWMSRPDTIVIPGDKLDLAMQLILAPIIKKLMKRKRAALGT